jgi:hypothetical protein
MPRCNQEDRESFLEHFHLFWGGQVTFAAQIGRTKAARSMGHCCPQPQDLNPRDFVADPQNATLDPIVAECGPCLPRAGPKVAQMPGQLPSPSRKPLLIITSRKQTRRYRNNNSQRICGGNDSLRKVC